MPHGAAHVSDACRGAMSPRDAPRLSAAGRGNSKKPSINVAGVNARAHVSLSLILGFQRVTIPRVLGFWQEKSPTSVVEHDRLGISKIGWTTTWQRALAKEGAFS